MYKTFFGSIGIALAMSLVPVGDVFAEQSKEVSAEQKAAVLAEVNVHNARVVGQEGAKITIAFDVANGNGTQSGLRYGLRLVRVEHGLMQTVASRIYDETFDVGERTTVSKQAIFEAPAYLSGTYSLWISLENGGGLRVGDAPIQGDVVLNGSGEYLELSENDCTLTVLLPGGVSDPNIFTLRQGVDIQPTEGLEVECIVQSSIRQPADVHPSMRVHVRNSMGPIILGEEVSQDVLLHVAPQTETKITLPVRTAHEAGAYDTALTLVDSAGMPQSNTVYIHYVVMGKGGKIQSVSLDGDMYRSGDTALVSVVWSGPADSFAGLRRGTGTALVSPDLALTMVDGAGNPCIEDYTASLQGKESPIVLPALVTRTCKDPHGEVILRDNGHELDRATFRVVSEVGEAGVWALVRTFWPFALFLVLLSALLAQLLFARRRDTPSITTLPLLLFVAAGVPFGVRADTFSPSFIEYGAQVVDNEFPFVSLPSPISPTSDFVFSWRYPVHEGVIFTAGLDNSDNTYIAGGESPSDRIIVSGSLSASACDNVSDLYELTASTNGETRTVFSKGTIDVAYYDSNSGQDSVRGVQDVTNAVGQVGLTIPSQPGEYKVVLTGTMRAVIYGLTAFNSGDAGQYVWTPMRQQVSYEIPYTVLPKRTCGTLPAGSEASGPNEESYVPQGVAWTHSETDHPAVKCEYKCKSPATWDAAAGRCTVTTTPPPPGTNSCQGSLPSGALPLNATEEVDVPANTSWRFASGGVNTAAKCEYRFVCQQSIPPHGETWTDPETPGSWDNDPEETGLTGPVSWQYAAAETSRKCEFRCEDGYEWDGTTRQCRQSPYTCGGTPPSAVAHTAPASGNEIANGPNQTWHLVSADTNARCEYVPSCPEGQTYQNGTCTTVSTGQCVTPPGDASWLLSTLPWDDEESQGLSVDVPWTYAAVDGAPKCQVHCYFGQVLQNGVCVPQVAYECTGTVPPTFEPYDDETSGLIANTEWAYGAEDTNAPCEYHCPAGTQPSADHTRCEPSAYACTVNGVPAEPPSNFVSWGDNEQTGLTQDFEWLYASENTSRGCEYRCTDGTEPTGDGTGCRPVTTLCQGSIPDTFTSYGDGENPTPGMMPVPIWQYSAAQRDTVKCEYHCPAGTVREGDACVEPIYSCVGNLPTEGVEVYPGDTQGLVEDVAWQYGPEPSGTSRKCEFHCTSGATWNAGTGRCDLPPVLQVCAGSALIARYPNAPVSRTLSRGSSENLTVYFDNTVDCAGASIAQESGVLTGSDANSTLLIRPEGASAMRVYANETGNEPVTITKADAGQTLHIDYHVAGGPQLQVCAGSALLASGHGAVAAERELHKDSSEDLSVYFDDSTDCIGTDIAQGALERASALMPAAVSLSNVPGGTEKRVTGVVVGPDSLTAKSNGNEIGVDYRVVDDIPPGSGGGCSRLELPAFTTPASENEEGGPGPWRRVTQNTSARCEYKCTGTYDPSTHTCVEGDYTPQ